MRRNFFIPLLMLFLLSCEKVSDNDFTFLRFYGDAYENIGYSVSIADRGYFLTGQFTELTRDPNGRITASVRKMGVIRTDADGKEVWKKLIGTNATGTKVITLEDGNIVVTGYTIDPSNSQKDIYVARFEGDGEGFTEKTFRSPGNQYGTDIIKTDEGFLILGSTDVRREPSSEATGNADGKKDILLLKLNNNLEVTGSLATGFIGNDEAVALKADPNGGYMITGTTDRSDRPVSEQSGKNIFLLRVNSSVSTTQFRILGGTGDELAADLEVLSDGYLIAGTKGSEGDQCGYVWRMPFDIFAAPLSEHPVTIENSSQRTPFALNAICRYKTNMFLMAGQYGSGASDMLVFATDDDGYYIEGMNRISGGTGTQAAYDVISDSDDVVVIGKNSFDSNSMISLMKFIF